MAIVVVGSCNIDLISYTKCLPRPGETVTGSSFKMGCGGKGANQCVAAAKLGATTAMVARVGDDMFGELYLNNLKKFCIDTTYVKVTTGFHTGVAPIIVDEKGQNSIIINPGANLKMTQEDVLHAEHIIQNARVLLCQGEICPEATLTALMLGRKHGAVTLMNAAPASSSLDDAVYKYADIFCVNESEAETLTGFEVSNTQDAQLAAEKLLQKGCKCVIITLGKDGALCSRGHEHTLIKTKEVIPVDSTGAGDAFIGALAFFLSTKPSEDLIPLIEKACFIATYSVQHHGTQSSYPEKTQLPSDLFV